MVNVLVLGVSGMLGSVVFKYLAQNKEMKVFGTARNPNYQKENILLFDANEISQLDSQKFTELQLDYYINCIGIIKPLCKDDDIDGIKRAIKINAEFPWSLGECAKNHDIKVIQIGTDCVYSGKEGNYDEDAVHDPLDVYGKTKSLGEPLDGSTLIIRCSIIGPEMKEQTYSLLEWFLSQSEGGKIGGYEHHRWNGVTTLQFAQICEKIISTNAFDKLMAISHIHHYVPNNTVNKYELMNIFNDLYEKNLEIEKVNLPEQRIDRTLSTKYHELDKLSKKTSIQEALKELNEFSNL
ncbi:MAG: NAD-dependent epimerase/dehydratase family protein [Promethearchaeota archaeon]|nr:MAG: NAD-dependent epimerase/dehydratase family protein [Candidatus Lokiarchaeota archaeon]